MVTAGVLGTALSLEPKEPEIMRRKPRDPQAPILNGILIWRIVLVSLIILIGAYGLFKYELARGAYVAEARTVAANVVIFVGLFYLFNARSLTRSPFQLGLFTNPWAIGGALLMVLIQLLYTYAPFMNKLFDSAPMSLTLWVDVLVVSLAAYLIIKFEKWLRRRLAR
jgi:Ca2+-transporting ATPase